jgi:hypothetical protein
MAAVIVMEAVFEADLTKEQYAYRPQRSAHDAVREVHGPLNRGYTEVVHADLSSYLISGTGWLVLCRCPGLRTPQRIMSHRGKPFWSEMDVDLA